MKGTRNKVFLNFFQPLPSTFLLQDESTYVAVREVQSRMALVSNSASSGASTNGLTTISVISTQKILKDCTSGRCHFSSKVKGRRKFVEDLELFSSCCFGPRKISPELYGFGHVDKRTIIKVNDTEYCRETISAFLNLK